MNHSSTYFDFIVKNLESITGNIFPHFESTIFQCDEVNVSDVSILAKFKLQPVGWLATLLEGANT